MDTIDTNNYIEKSNTSNEVAMDKEKIICNIDILKITQKSLLSLDGHLPFIHEFSNTKVSILIGEDEYACDLIKRKTSSCYSQATQDCLGFVIKDIDISSIITEVKLRILVSIGNKEVLVKDFQYGEFIPFSESIDRAIIGNYIIKNYKSFISILKKTWSQSFKLKTAIILKALAQKKFRVVAVRLYVELFRFFHKNPVVLINDRVSCAGDNGEALFRYIHGIKDKKFNVYFVINKQCDDYYKMKKMGKVIDFGSTKHKIYAMIADYILGSHIRKCMQCPYYSKGWMKDYIEKKYIYLKHGIEKDDISINRNKYLKNLAGFITAAMPEYKSIINGEYYYDEDSVWLTGFARFDQLYSKPEKIISVMPTWRKYLHSDFDQTLNTKPKNHSFESSVFVGFYKKLLNDPRLILAAKENEYKIAFVPHPNVMPYISDFDINDNVIVLDYSYKNIFAKSNLVVTDYSSIQFDFAYLRKPMVYTHFDKEEFFSGKHSYTKGYFDYERDGFGEVEYDLDNTVTRIIEYIANNCLLKDKYKKRIDSFFCFNDKRNCERIYRKLLQLEEKG